MNISDLFGAFCLAREIWFLTFETYFLVALLLFLVVLTAIIQLEKKLIKNFLLLASKEVTYCHTQIAIPGSISQLVLFKIKYSKHSRNEWTKVEQM